MFDFREIEDQPKPFLEHIEDLRAMLLRCLIALAIAMAFCFLFREQIASLIQKPLESVAPERAKNLQSLGVADSMMISLEIAFYSGVVVAFPVLLYFIAQFILPGLTPEERRALFPAALGGFVLFLIGVVFAYQAVLPAALNFFFEDAKRMNWQPSWTVREYYSFTTQFIIAFGLAFELPVVVLFLVKIGLLSIERLRQARAFALILIFLFAAILTPTQDILTLFLMGGPMYLLYEGTILLISLLHRENSAASQ